jgi:hypothetical protein
VAAAAEHEQAEITHPEDERLVVEDQRVRLPAAVAQRLVTFEAPCGGYTSKRVGMLADTVRGFGAGLFVEGHGEAMLSAAALDERIAEARSIAG